MKKKRKKTIMYIAVIVISLGLLVIWFFQFKINFKKSSQEDGFFSKMKNAIQTTDQSYKKSKLKDLLDSNDSNDININKLKDKVLQKYVKEKIKEKK